MEYNPHYSPEKFNLEMLVFDEPGMSYEFNTLCFWATEDGKVYSASDSGCSCPTPFERFDSETQDELFQTLERVGSVEQAESIFESWNKNYDGKPFLPNERKQEAMNWVKEHLKQ